MQPSPSPSAASSSSSISVIYLENKESATTMKSDPNYPMSLTTSRSSLGILKPTQRPVSSFPKPILVRSAASSTPDNSKPTKPSIFPIPCVTANDPDENSTPIVSVTAVKTEDRSPKKKKKKVTFVLPVSDLKSRSSLFVDLERSFSSTSSVGARSRGGARNERDDGDEDADDDRDSILSLEMDCPYINYTLRLEKQFLGISVPDWIFVVIAVLLLVPLNLMLCALCYSYAHNEEYMYFAYTLSWIAVNVISTLIYRFRRQYCRGPCCRGDVNPPRRRRRRPYLRNLLLVVRAVTFLDPLFVARDILNEAGLKRSIYHVTGIKEMYKQHWLAVRYYTARPKTISKLKVQSLLSSATHSWQAIGLVVALTDNARQSYNEETTLITVCLWWILVLFAWAVSTNLPRKKNCVLVSQAGWVVLLVFMKSLWLLLISSSRIIAFLLYATAFGTSLFYIIAIQFLLIYAWLLCLTPSFSSCRALSLFLYKPLLASLYLLAFCHPETNQFEHSYGIFYLVMMWTNLWMMYTALEASVDVEMSKILIGSSLFYVAILFLLLHFALVSKVHKQSKDIEIVW